jgi:hypothetical protein
MTLVEKIITIYPELTIVDFGYRGTINIQDDSDGKGPYIKEWNHPTLTRPTQAQLDSVEE